MNEYTVYLVERFGHGDGDTINHETIYVGEIMGGSAKHPFTDGDPRRLFERLASEYKPGDTFITLEKSVIHAKGVKGLEVELAVPLSTDELRFLALSLLNAKK